MYCRTLTESLFILDVRETNRLEVLIKTDTALDYTIGGIWFPFKIETQSFIMQFGDIASFKESIQDHQFVLNYYFPNYKSGYVSLKEQVSTIEDKNKAEVFTLNSLVNGLSPKNNKAMKIIKSNAYSDTALKIEDNSIFLAANKNTFLHVTESGTTLGGNTHIQGSPSNFKFAGFVSMQNFFLGLIPSTYTSPISSFKLSLPIEQLNDLKEISGIVTGAII